ncbi:hypothetical protein PMAYCL1PPCAC_04881, partial [Pristionchus mayeri]
KTKNLCRILTISLISQALVPVITVIFPFSLIGLFSFATPEIYLSLIDVLGFDVWDVVILTVSFHASLHMTVLMFTTPAFRAKLRTALACYKKVAPASAPTARRG